MYTACNTSHPINLLLFPDKNGTEKACLLVDCVIATLHTVFLYDSHNFVNKERFTNLMAPLVDQVTKLMTVEYES